MAVITVTYMNIDKITIIPLFPTPVFTYDVDVDEGERLFLLNQYPDNVKDNAGNSTSKDANILKNKEVKLLQKKLLF